MTQTLLVGGLLLLSIAYFVVFWLLIFVLEAPRAGRFLLPVMSLGSSATLLGTALSIAFPDPVLFSSSGVWAVLFVTVQFASLWTFNVSILGWVLKELRRKSQDRNR